MDTIRRHGKPPFEVAVVHGGPGAGGEMKPVAEELASGWGVLEPIQTATSLEGQVNELRGALTACGDPPLTLIGFSWGAWLALVVAARYPSLVQKLILVGSGPFESAYVAQLRHTRLQRLSRTERSEFQSIMARLADPSTADRDSLMARLGGLVSTCDVYDPIPPSAAEGEGVCVRGDVYEAVWREATEMRSSGELLEYAKRVRCPVVAVHGDYDPHPAEGVRRPLSAVLDAFRFLLLENCGHKPWIERQARGAFYRALRAELLYRPPAKWE